ncbi:MAG: hypothetical protein JXR37_31780 [Kiritimatiellae bacterium]|nr:hypothetical protein [Kiritimatiellia bacterium]
MKKSVNAADLLDDVVSVLGELEFEAQEGSCVSGRLVAVEIVSLPGRGSELEDRRSGIEDQRQGLFNLDLALIPLGPRTEVAPAVLRAGRKAFEAALEDPNPQIRAEAEHRLKLLEIPQVDLRTLAGMPVVLRAGQESRVAFLNERGEAVFDAVPQAKCRLLAGHSWGRSEESIPFFEKGPWFRSAASADGEIVVRVGRNVRGTLCVEAETPGRAAAHETRLLYLFVNASDNVVRQTGELTLKKEQEQPDTKRAATADLGKAVNFGHVEETELVFLAFPSAPRRGGENT